MLIVKPVAAVPPGGGLTDTYDYRIGHPRFDVVKKSKMEYFA